MEETRDYVLDCSVHGLECKVLCFRAFADNELELLLESLTKSPQHVNNPRLESGGL